MINYDFLMNSSVENLTKECLGYAEDVYEHVLVNVHGFRRVKKNLHLLKVVKTRNRLLFYSKVQLNMFSINLKMLFVMVFVQLQTQLKMVRFISFMFTLNYHSLFCLGCVIGGGGAFEIVAHQALTQYKEQVKGRARLGVQAFAEALLIIPKAIAQNAGHDQQETIVKLQHEYTTSKIPVGIDITTGKYFLSMTSKVILFDIIGEAMEPKSLGIYDNYRVKKQLIHSSTSIASNLILVDEILRAGLSSLRPGGQ
jgi:hypothetical protein